MTKHRPLLKLMAFKLVVGLVLLEKVNTLPQEAPGREKILTRNQDPFPHPYINKCSQNTLHLNDLHRRNNGSPNNGNLRANGATLFLSPLRLQRKALRDLKLAEHPPTSSIPDRRVR